MKELWVKKTIFRRLLINNNEIEEVRQILENNNDFESTSIELIEDEYDQNASIEYDNEYPVFPIQYVITGPSTKQSD